MKFYNKLSKAQSIIHAINIINSDPNQRDPLFTNEYLAAQYAFESVLNSPDDDITDDDSIYFKLNYLKEEGADFVLPQAMKIANSFVDTFYNYIFAVIPTSRTIH